MLALTSLLGQSHPEWVASEERSAIVWGSVQRTRTPEPRIPGEATLLVVHRSLITNGARAIARTLLVGSDTQNGRG